MLIQSQKGSTPPRIYIAGRPFARLVEWLCQRYEVVCPDWVDDRAYILPEPWFYYPQEHLREQLIQQTLQAFTKRNIYCGNRMFANKYEFAEQFRRSA